MSRNSGEGEKAMAKERDEAEEAETKKGDRLFTRWRKFVGNVRGLTEVEE